MGKSIDPMWKEKAGSGSGAHSRRSSASISLQPVIPWRVAFQQSPPPLHRPTSECDKVVLPVNQFGDKGNPVAPVNFNRPPESPVAKQRTELSLKKHEKLSEQPGPVHTLYGTRRVFLEKFPYFHVYQDDRDEVYVIAVARAKRRPGYWKKRI